jgi:hypothetical protein
VVHVQEDGFISFCVVPDLYVDVDLLFELELTPVRYLPGEVDVYPRWRVDADFNYLFQGFLAVKAHDCPTHKLQDQKSVVKVGQFERIRLRLARQMVCGVVERVTGLTLVILFVVDELVTQEVTPADASLVPVGRPPIDALVTLGLEGARTLGAELMTGLTRISVLIFPEPI